MECGTLKAHQLNQSTLYLFIGSVNNYTDLTVYHIVCKPPFGPSFYVKKNVKSFINSSQKVEDKPKSIDRPTIKVIHKYLILTVKLKKLYLPNIKTPASNILAQLHTTILSYEIATKIFLGSLFPKVVTKIK